MSDENEKNLYTFSSQKKNYFLIKKELNHWEMFKK